MTTTTYDVADLVSVSMYTLILGTVLGCIRLHSTLAPHSDKEKSTFYMVYSLPISSTLFGVLVTSFIGAIVVVAVSVLGCICIWSTGEERGNILLSPFAITMCFLEAYNAAIGNILWVNVLHWCWKKLDTACFPPPQLTISIVLGYGLHWCSICVSWVNSGALLDCLTCFLYLSGYIVGTIALVLYASILA